MCAVLTPKCEGYKFENMHVSALCAYIILYSTHHIEIYLCVLPVKSLRKRYVRHFARVWIYIWAVSVFPPRRRVILGSGAIFFFVVRYYHGVHETRVTIEIRRFYIKYVLPSRASHPTDIFIVLASDYILKITKP